VFGLAMFSMWNLMLLSSKARVASCHAMPCVANYKFDTIERNTVTNVTCSLRSQCRVEATILFLFIVEILLLVG
jgi:hypothetical protein